MDYCIVHNTKEISKGQQIISADIKHVYGYHIGHFHNWFADKIEKHLKKVFVGAFILIFIKLYQFKILVIGLLDL